MAYPAQRDDSGYTRCSSDSAWVGDVSEFPKFDFSKRQVSRAGEALRGNLIWNDATAENIRFVFSVATNWRDSHAYPMRVIRSEISHVARRIGPSPITAARLKRMISIRKKLNRVRENLTQLQDLAGCRIILPTMSDVERFVAEYTGNCRHVIHHQNNHIATPKADGYRSWHLVLSYKGKDSDAVFDGRRVEVQVRTRLQHSWATAVEAIGLFRREDLKGGQGNSDWLRLFQLMASELALAEGMPLVDGTEDRPRRIEEIKELDKALMAASTLDNLAWVANYVETGFIPPEKPRYWQLTYDHVNKAVKVEGFFSPVGGTRSYDESETAIERSGLHLNTVLVEVDAVENLIEAYPNYFGDVQLFKNSLTKIVSGADVTEYRLPPQHTPSLKRQKAPASEGEGFPVSSEFGA